MRKITAAFFLILTIVVLAARVPQAVARPDPTATPPAIFTEAPTPTPMPVPVPPTEIDIPSIGLHSAVVEMGAVITEIDGRQRKLLPAHPSLVGWYNESDGLNYAGNVVMYGHGGSYAAVLRDLHKVEVGDRVILTDYNMNKYVYTVSEKQVIKDVGISYEQKIKNGEIMYHTDDYRVTIITCWPDQDHRLAVIAKRVQ